MNLLRRHINIQAQELLCVFCNDMPEDTSHFLFNFTTSQNIWKRWYYLIGLSSALPHTPIKHFCLHSHGWWVGVPLFWNLWLHRNAIVLRTFSG